MRSLRYLSVFSLPLLAYVAFHTTGWLTFLPWIYAFGLIPVAELFIRPDHSNLSEQERVKQGNNPLYDWVVYLMVPVQYLLLIFFLRHIDDPGLTALDRTGRIFSMGLLCGVLGINVAHELGHRKSRSERLLSKMLLLTSLYMHFFIEHNRGHHARVSTDEDPASARPGEPVYFFWWRSIVFSYLSAWKLEFQRLSKKGRKRISLHNQMLWFQLIQVVALGVIYFLFGIRSMTTFMAAALIGILLLETVNYIEHYGLRREKHENGRYERTKPAHSWNSDHVLGRWMLFELSRHSDHHFIASRKYHLLQYHEQSPQMPTGYPGMMILSLLPPLWFHVMNQLIEKQQFKVVSQDNFEIKGEF